MKERKGKGGNKRERKGKGEKLREKKGKAFCIHISRFMAKKISSMSQKFWSN